MKNQSSEELRDKAGSRQAWSRRRVVAMAGAGALIGVALMANTSNRTNSPQPERMAMKARGDVPGTPVPTVRGGAVPVKLTQAVPASIAVSADSLYEDARLAALCLDQHGLEEFGISVKSVCARVTPRSQREADGMLLEAAKKGSAGARSDLLRRDVQQASAQLKAIDPKDTAERAETLAKLKASVEELHTLALASGDPQQLILLSSLYLRNTDVFEGADVQAAALTIASGLSTGSQAGDFDNIYEAYSPEKSAQIKQLAGQIVNRIRDASAKSGGGGLQAGSADLNADCRTNKNGANPCNASPFGS